MKFIVVLICVIFAASTAYASISTCKTEIVLVDDIEDYKKDNPEVELEALEVPLPQPRVGIRYTLGFRQADDKLVAQKSDFTSYAGPRDVQLVLTYPSNGGQGSIVTFVQVEVNQSTNKGRGYVSSGGIGKRSIQIVIEAKKTTYFEYNASIYGRDWVFFFVGVLWYLYCFNNSNVYYCINRT